MSDSLSFDALAALLQARQTVLPKRLGAPGPDAAQLAAILGAAAHAPDHGGLLPWRFVRIPLAARPALAEAFAQALAERNPEAAPDQLAQARDKAFRAPELLVLVVDGACGDPAIGWDERLVSAGCAVQNVLLMATALGFGSALTSGKALKSDALRRLLALGPAEHALCCLSVGSVSARKPTPPRPGVPEIVRTLTDAGPIDGLHTEPNPDTP